MKAIVVVLVVFVGMVITAPQGPNYPYRPQVTNFGVGSYSPVQDPVAPQRAYRPPGIQHDRFRSSSSTAEPPVEPTLQQLKPNLSPKPYVVILKQSQEDNFDGSFSYSFESENGISLKAEGGLKNPGTENEAQVISGTYSYIAPDGTHIQTEWFADDTGFHAQGDHIPMTLTTEDVVAQLIPFKRSLPEEKKHKNIDLF